MNKQIVAIVAIIAIILTAGMSLPLAQSGDGEDFRIVSSVNTGGSGIYMKRGIIVEWWKDFRDLRFNYPLGEPQFDKDAAKDYGKSPLIYDEYADAHMGKGVSYLFNKEFMEKYRERFRGFMTKHFGGLVMGTPGVSSIQHIQLQQLVESSGLKFKAYMEGEVLDGDTLYYIPDLNTFNMIESNTKIDGGIIWAPQQQRIVKELSSKYGWLAFTNDHFGDHMCCVVVANQGWLNDNRDAAVNFLKGYVEGVKFVNDKGNHNELIKIAKELTKIDDEYVLEEALKNVKYRFDDSGKGDLSKLGEDIKEFSSKLRDAGHISDDKLQNIKQFVNDSFIKEALRKNVNNTDTVKVKIPVSIIDGDIHHIAAYVAYKKGYFEHYGLEVDFKGCNSGVKVAEMLLSGDVKIGFLGAPPAIIKLA